MPKVEKIEDRWGITEPLRITRLREYKTIHSTILPRIRVKCGCCENAVEISYDTDPTGDICENILEIDGVVGTVRQWRQALLPLLGMEVSEI